MLQQESCAPAPAVAESAWRLCVTVYGEGLRIISVLFQNTLSDLSQAKTPRSGRQAHFLDTRHGAGPWADDYSWADDYCAQGRTSTSTNATYAQHELKLTREVQVYTACTSHYLRPPVRWLLRRWGWKVVVWPREAKLPAALQV